MASDPWQPAIDDLQSQIDAINTQMTNMQTQMTSLDNRLTALETAAPGELHDVWLHIEAIENISILQSHMRSYASNVLPGIPFTEEPQIALEEK